MKKAMAGSGSVGVIIIFFTSNKGAAAYGM
jgi:hypothetical protein